MKTTIAAAALITISILSLTETASAQRSGLPFGIGSQVIRNSASPSRQRTQVQPATRRFSATPSQSGLSFGGKDSAVAISLGPGGVGVGVGTDDTAVAVAVGGGGVGVGVAHEDGTAVSVGAGDGGVAVGVTTPPRYRTFGGPQSLTSQTPGVATFGSARRSGNRVAAPLTSGRFTQGTTTRSGSVVTGGNRGLTRSSGYWSFAK